MYIYGNPPLFFGGGAFFVFEIIYPIEKFILNIK